MLSSQLTIICTLFSENGPTFSDCPEMKHMTLLRRPRWACQLVINGRVKFLLICNENPTSLVVALINNMFIEHTVYV